MRNFSTLLDLVNPEFWNIMSFMYAYTSRSTIGSPVTFAGPDGLRLREVSILALSDFERRRFLEFSYPLDIQDRSTEISYDRQYWKESVTFLVEDMADGGKIVGCAQFLPKTDVSLLPVEHATVVDGSMKVGQFNACENSGGQKSAEIYRLRRSFDMNPEKAPALIAMLFKAIWAKVIQTSTRYLYLSCDPSSPELRNLYMRRLSFTDDGIRITYGSGRPWTLLRMDCLKHEMDFAKRSPKHFVLQTYCRRNLRSKRLRVEQA